MTAFKWVLALAVLAAAGATKSALASPRASAHRDERSNAAAPPRTAPQVTFPRTTRAPSVQHEGRIDGTLGTRGVARIHGAASVGGGARNSRTVVHDRGTASIDGTTVHRRPLR